MPDRGTGSVICNNTEECNVLCNCFNLFAVNSDTDDSCTTVYKVNQALMYCSHSLIIMRELVFEGIWEPSRKTKLRAENLHQLS